MRVEQFGLAVTLLMGVAAVGLSSCGQKQESAAAPSVDDATAFVAKAETDLANMSEYAGRAAWVMSNFITDDTEWLQARAGAEANAMASTYAKEAARFDGVDVDPVTRRKLNILKRAIVLPTPAKVRRRKWQQYPPVWIRPIRPASSNTKACLSRWTRRKKFYAARAIPPRSKPCGKAGTASRRR